MSRRKKPVGEELQQLLETYHDASHVGKLDICQRYGISYATLKNWINQEARPLPPEFKHQHL